MTHSTIRWRFFDAAGNHIGSVTRNVLSGDTHGATTKHIPFSYSASIAAVTAVVARHEVSDAGTALH